jgi:predicted NBD/HSP70 family sugar kinase
MVGAARGHRSAVGITLGTGVGSSFVREGHILRDGPGVPPEGRVDLLRYAGTPLEETVSRRAIRRAYVRATGESPPPDVREIAQRARHGDKAAVDVFTQTFRALGTVLGPHLVEFEDGGTSGWRIHRPHGISWPNRCEPDSSTPSQPQNQFNRPRTRFNWLGRRCSARHIWLPPPVRTLMQKSAPAEPAAAVRLRQPRHDGQVAEVHDCAALPHTRPLDVITKTRRL